MRCWEYDPGSYWIRICNDSQFSDKSSKTFFAENWIQRHYKSQYLFCGVLHNQWQSKKHAVPLINNGYHYSSVVGVKLFCWNDAMCLWQDGGQNLRMTIFNRTFIGILKMVIYSYFSRRQTLVNYLTKKQLKEPIP